MAYSGSLFAILHVLAYVTACGTGGYRRDACDLLRRIVCQCAVVPYLCTGPRIPGVSPWHTDSHYGWAMLALHFKFSSALELPCLHVKFTQGRWCQQWLAYLLRHYIGTHGVSSTECSAYTASTKQVPDAYGLVMSCESHKASPARSADNGCVRFASQAKLSAATAMHAVASQVLHRPIGRVPPPAQHARTLKPLTTSVRPQTHVPSVSRLSGLERSTRRLGLSGIPSASFSQAVTPKMDTTAIKSATVVVATKPGCPYCRKAKTALQQAGVAFQELDASQDAGLRALVRELSGSATVPQVFVGGVSIGGSDDLMDGLASGSFTKAVNKARSQCKRALPDAIVKCVEQVAKRASSATTTSRKESAADTAQRAALEGVAELMARSMPRTQATVWGRKQQCFSGKQLVGWLVEQAKSKTPDAKANDATLKWLKEHCSSPDSAAQAGQKLLQAQLITVASETMPALTSYSVNTGLLLDRQYFLVQEAAAPVRGQPLNTLFWWSRPGRPASQVAQDLRELIMHLYDTHLSADGKSVNYAGIKNDPLFDKYVQATAELQRVSLAPLDRQELMALFINLYNALIIHATVALGSPQSGTQRWSFFSKEAAYIIDGHTYTADDMEHGVLRGNRPTASNVFAVLRLPQLASGPFKEGDARLAHVVAPMDARIHFALVCGAKSCPPISIYTPDNLEEGLQAAAEAFCNGEVEVDVAAGVVQTSKILQWYSADFGSNDQEKLQYILPFLKGKLRQDMEALLKSGRRIQIRYKPYDWGLNE